MEDTVEHQNDTYIIICECNVKVFHDDNVRVQMEMEHEEKLMELQTMVSDQEGFSRFVGMNYSDVKHFLSTLKANVSNPTTDCSVFMRNLKLPLKKMPFSSSDNTSSKRSLNIITTMEQKWFHKMHVESFLSSLQSLNLEDKVKYVLRL